MDIRVVLPKEGWTERWLRPILIATIPAVIALYGVWHTTRTQERLDGTQRKLDDAEAELERTREELERAREELKQHAFKAARAEVERANEARIKVTRELVRSEKRDKPWPMAMGAPAIEHMEERRVLDSVAKKWKNGEPPVRYMEQAVLEHRAKKGR